jgi:lysozyme
MYHDSGGLPTIGVGHLLTKDEVRSGKVLIGGESIHWRDGLTEAQIETLLRQDLAALAEPLQHIETALPVILTQQQRDSLACFIFNVGPTAFLKSTLCKRLQTGDLDAVPAQMRRWFYSAGKRDPGLVNRREREIALWEGGSGSALA